MRAGAKAIWYEAIGAAVRRRRFWWLAVGGCCLLSGAAVSPWRPGLVFGHSMEPTLSHGSAFLYDRTYYRHHPLRTGDVVLARHGGEVWIKRVYATGGAQFWTLRSGDQQEIRHDPIREPEQTYFARAVNRLRRSHGVRYRVVRLRVPPGWVFLVGDNTTSVDSRVSGPVEASEILGRVVTLPGQQLGGVPEWVELSSPRFRRTEAMDRPLEKEAGSGRRI